MLAEHHPVSPSKNSLLSPPALKSTAYLVDLAVVLEVEQTIHLGLQAHQVTCVGEETPELELSHLEQNKISRQGVAAIYADTGLNGSAPRENCVT